MREWTTVSAWQERRRALVGRKIGFVPTMGALHEGHAAMIRRCRDENEIAIVSIFVNPLQFNDPEDLKRYPRTRERDLALLESLRVDDVFAPNAADLYPMGYRFRVQEPGLPALMEAAYRPGFLEGVLTVVLKLLLLVRPNRAYFGEKDYQQLQAVTDLVHDFFVPVEVVPFPTVREPSGLAMSSRNALLPEDAREKAAMLFRALTIATTPEEAKAILDAEGFETDYVEDHWGRRFAAAMLAGVRLIDNVLLPKE